MDGYRFDSGLPVLGTLFVIIACLIGFGAAGTAMVLLVISLIDTGGVPWFVFMSWRDKGLWDS